MLLRGVGLNPLSLILECADRGNLEEVINVFREAGVQLRITTVQQTLSQVSHPVSRSFLSLILLVIKFKVAAAVSYLHDQTIIHRDLKPENVLVWSFPFAHQDEDQTQHKVQVKLSDYGISRIAGRLGSRDDGAHSPRYTAPELLQHAGQVSYSDKVSSLLCQV